MENTSILTLPVLATNDFLNVMMVLPEHSFRKASDAVCFILWVSKTGSTFRKTNDEISIFFNRLQLSL